MSGAFLSKDSYFSKDNFFHVVASEWVEDTPPHVHDFFELAYVESGIGINVVNGVEQLVRKGDFFILEPTTTHCYRKLGNQKLIIHNCLFLPELIDSTLKDSRNLEEILNSYLIKVDARSLKIPPYLIIFHDKENSILNIVQSLQREYDEKKFAYSEIARTLFIQIIIFAIRELDRDTPLRQQTISAQLIEEIEKNPQSNNILQSFAKRINYSVPYISRKFKEETGHTFISHLQKYRIELSCRLLATTDLSIAEVADHVGYVDWTFFHKLFKSIMHCTPLEFRKRYKAIPGK